MEEVETNEHVLAFHEMELDDRILKVNISYNLFFIFTFIFLCLIGD